MRKNLIVGLIATLSVLLLVTVAFCSEAWRFETNFECLANREASTTPVVFSQHDTTITIAEHYAGVISVQDGVIIPGEPICLSDEEPGVLIKLSEPESGYEVRVIQLGDEPVEVYYTLAYTRYGYAYEYELPSPGADGVYQYAYRPQRIVRIRIVNGALDDLVIEDHGDGYDGGVPTELERSEPMFQVLAAHAAKVERDKMAAQRSCE